MSFSVCQGIADFINYQINKDILGTKINSTKAFSNLHRASKHVLVIFLKLKFLLLFVYS